MRILKTFLQYLSTLVKKSTNLYHSQGELLADAAAAVLYWTRKYHTLDTHNIVRLTIVSVPVKKTEKSIRCKKFNQSITGDICRGMRHLVILQRQPWQSPCLNLHARPLVIPNNSLQESLTFPTHKLCERPLTFLQARLSLSETT